MGRKPGAATRKLTSGHLDKSVSPSVDGTELPADNAKTELERPEFQSGIKKSLETETPKRNVQTDPAVLSLGKKKQHSASARVRRSLRLQNLGTAPRRNDIEHIIGEITISESENEDEPSPGEEETHNMDYENGKDQEKIEHLLDLLEEQRNTLEAMREKSSLGHIRYKRMYISSQRKIETLTDANHQLALKLEIALAKLEAYENGNRMFLGALEKMKDMIVIPNQTKLTEKADSMTFQTTAGPYTSQDSGRELNSPLAKRKKLDKESKRNTPSLF